MDNSPDTFVYTLTVYTVLNRIYIVVSMNRKCPIAQIVFPLTPYNFKRIV